MRNSIFKLSGLLVLSLALSFSSCKKQVAGPQGDPGVDGKKGNLKKTDRSFTVADVSWQASVGTWTSNVYAPEITNDVLMKGEVKVYMKVGEKWWSLPYAVGDIFMEQSTEISYLHLKYSKIHGGPPPSPWAVMFKLVTFAPVN